VGRDPDQRRLEVAVRLLGFLDAGVGVNEAPRPLIFVHERARLGLARGQLVRVQSAPSLPCQSILTGVIALQADAVESRAERIAGRLTADGSIPTRIVPSNTCSEVEHGLFTLPGSDSGYTDSWT